MPLVGALLLSVLLMLFGDGPGTSRARVNLGPVQPIEAIRLLLALFPRRLLRAALGAAPAGPRRADRAHRVPAWLQLPRPEYVLPIVVGVGAALLFFFVQSDLGPALFLRLRVPGDVRRRPRARRHGARRHRVAARRLLSSATS